MQNTVYFGDNLKLLNSLPDNGVDLIYIDPPFNTGKVQARKRFRTVRAQDGEGDRIGFGGNSYQGVYFKQPDGSYQNRNGYSVDIIIKDGTATWHSSHDGGICKIMP